MRQPIACALVLVLFVAGCGGKSATPPSRVLEVAGPNPSASATMVCAQEAQGDIASAIGVEAKRVSKPVWNQAAHLLSCDYDYAGSTRMVLTVKEMSSPAETGSYYESEATRLGRTKTFEIGEGAFRTTNGSLVVRKDYKVLFIDVSHLPSSFGKPLDDRATIGVNVATVIMSCWSGE